MQFRLFAASAALLGWNNLGMHCMDSDYSVFSVLPPYNTIEANLIVNGRLITDSSYSITYQAVADPTGSVNSTAVGKGNFYDFSLLLYGADLTPDQGYRCCHRFPFPIFPASWRLYQLCEPVR